MSVRIQITLPDDLAAQLKRTAARMKVPAAQIVREATREKLRQMNGRGRKKGGNFFARIDGLVQSDEHDLSARVDEIVYGEDV